MNVAILGTKVESLPFGRANSLLSDRGRAAAPVDTRPCTAAEMSLLYPIIAEMKQNFIPKQAHLHPTVVIPAGNSRTEPKEGDRTRTAQCLCCPLFFGIIPCRARSWTRSLWFFPAPGLPSICPQGCSVPAPHAAVAIAGQGWLRSTVWEHSGSPALERSLQLPLRAKG